MANVEHSALTGSDLHEPKGVAAAVANRVYVSNGASSGSWTTVTNSVLAAEAKAFQASLLHIQDQKAQGTDGGTTTTGALSTRVLNTVVTNEITGASLSSNQITLPTGVYWVDAKATIYEADGNALIFYNVTDAISLRGLNAFDSNTGAAQNTASIRGRVTIASQKVFELRHAITTGQTTTGFGKALSGSGLEIYADICIWKVG